MIAALYVEKGGCYFGLDGDPTIDSRLLTKLFNK